jgi:hypothetical protein
MDFTVDGRAPTFRAAGEHIRFVRLEVTDR